MTEVRFLVNTSGEVTYNSEFEQPPLNLAENAEQGLQEERRFGLLRTMRDAGEIEAGTEEMKIIAAASDPSAEGKDPDQPLTENQQKAAKRLAEREKKQRSVERVRDFMRQRGSHRPPNGRKR